MLATNDVTPVAVLGDTNCGCNSGCGSCGF